MELDLSKKELAERRGYRDGWHGWHRMVNFYVPFHIEYNTAYDEAVAARLRSEML